MYRWYQKAAICYVYLTDIPTATDVFNPCVYQAYFDENKLFSNSRWFKRGWTLQELIAPSVVEFYAHDWTEIGTKSSLSENIATITGIRRDVLLGSSVQSENAAEKMSWAAERTTTRVEDRAYSLMGLFDVNMPLIYGEGNKAFARLQAEILRNTNDYTLLTTGLTQSRNQMQNLYMSTSRVQSNPDIITLTEATRIYLKLPPEISFLDQHYNEGASLAETPMAFLNRHPDIFRYSELKIDHDHDGFAPHLGHPEVTLKGLKLRLSIYDWDTEWALAYLNCRLKDMMVCALLRRRGKDHEQRYCRVNYTGLDLDPYILNPVSQLKLFSPKFVYLKNGTRLPGRLMPSLTLYRPGLGHIDLHVHGPKLEVAIGWSPSLSMTQVDKGWMARLGLYDDIVLRLVYNKKLPFLLVTKGYLGGEFGLGSFMQIRSCLEPMLLNVTSGAEPYQHGSWDALALRELQHHFESSESWSRLALSNSKNGLSHRNMNDRVFHDFKDIAVSVAMRKLLHTITIKVVFQERIHMQYMAGIF